MRPKKKDIQSPADHADALKLNCTASSSECTGLIPNLPENEDAQEAYRDIYDYGPPDPDDFAAPGGRKENKDYGKK